MREADEAMFNTEDCLAVDPALIDTLKARAAAAPRGRYRLCLHHATDDAVQEMIVAFRRHSYSRPHCHPHSSASIHIIEGEMDVFLFDEEGNVMRRIEMGPYGSGKVFCVRSEAGGWHMTVPRSEVTVMHEAIAGPFVPDRSNVFAAWSPEEPDPDAAAFVAGLYAQE